jgi:hypothetical protein
MAIPIVSLACWFPSQVAEAVASSCASASCYRHSEDIGVVTIVIFELAFRDVEWQIFFADLVIAADNRPLEDRPEAFNGLSVHRTDNVLLGAVHDRLVRIFAKALVGNLFVRCEQADLGRNRFAHEFLQIDRRQSAEHAGNDAALALDRADDGGLKVLPMFAAGALLGPVLIDAFAADESFVHLDDAHQLAKFLVLQRRTDAVADIPSRLVGAEPHVALYLHGADALLSAKHQVDDLEPVPQIDLGILENRPDKVREAISATLTAIRAFPLKFHGLKRINVRRAAARAMDALRPAVCDQVVVASLLVREKLVELGRRQLVRFLSHVRLSNLEERLAC